MTQSLDSLLRLNSSIGLSVLTDTEQERLVGGKDEEDPEEGKIFLDWLGTLFDTVQAVGSSSSDSARDYLGNDPFGVKFRHSGGTQDLAHEAVFVAQQKEGNFGYGNDDDP